VATGGIAAASFAAGAIDAAAIANNAIDSATLATDVTGRIAGSVWDAVRASYATAGSFGDIDTSADVAAAVLSAAAAAPIDANIQEINDVTIVGDGDATPFNV
jgi:hypothetical protein